VGEQQGLSQSLREVPGVVIEQLGLPQGQQWSHRGLVGEQQGLSQSLLEVPEVVIEQLGLYQGQH